MNSRKRMTVLALGVVALVGLLAAGYVFLAEPYLKRAQSVKKMESDAILAQGDLLDLQGKNQKLMALQKRSLPAGPKYPDDPKRQKREYADVARAEYEQALTRLLRDSGARNATVDYVDGESNNKAGIPQIDPGTRPGRDADPADYLAYTQVVFKIEIPKTDLGTISDVLRRYYSLDLLHQITHLNIKQSVVNELGQDKRPLKERNDLKVELTTRAIIVHDAPRRQSLTPSPNPLVALVGVGGAQAYEQSSTVSRKLLTDPIERTLASKPPRDYSILPAKDVFHGTYEPPPPPVVGGKGPEIIVPKPDFREHIRYTTCIHSSQGNIHVVEVTIRDKANNEDYMVTITQEGEQVVARTIKYVFDNHKLDPAERKKKDRGYDSKVLDISRASTMRNKNEFTVYGVDTDDSLIVGERPTGLSPEFPKDDKTQPRPVVGGQGRPTTRPTLPPADPKAALVGGMVVTAPKAEKFYRWEYGKNLSQIVELSKGEAEKAIQRAQTRFLPDAKTTSAAPAGEVKKDEKP